MKKKTILKIAIFSSLVLIIAVSNFIYFYDPFNWRVQEKDLILHYELAGIFATREYKPLLDFNLSDYTTETITKNKNCLNVTIELDLFFYSESFFFRVENKVSCINVTYFDSNKIINSQLITAPEFENGFCASWAFIITHSFSDLRIVLLLEFYKAKKITGELR